MTHIEVLELEVVPEHLLVIGGGYVGIELAQAMRRFGSKVTMLEQGERLLPREDDDVVEGLCSLLNDEGIEVVVNARIKRVLGWSGQSVRVVIEQHGAEKTLDGTHRGCYRPHAQYGGNRTRVGGRRSERARISQGQRAAADDSRKCLGDRRGRRQPTVHQISIDDFGVVDADLTGVSA